MPNITKTINGKEYTFGSIKVGVARRMRTKYPETSDYNVAFIAAALQAGGHEEATYEWVDDQPFFDGLYLGLLNGAYEANGMQLKGDQVVPKAGEELPAAVPAEGQEAEGSTSSTSTAV